MPRRRRPRRRRTPGWLRRLPGRVRGRQKKRIRAYYVPVQYQRRRTDVYMFWTLRRREVYPGEARRRVFFRILFVKRTTGAAARRLTRNDALEVLRRRGKLIRWEPIRFWGWYSKKAGPRPTVAEVDRR